jgi:hypothetical protein
MDIHNQLKFLGIQDSSSMMELFKGTISCENSNFYSRYRETQSKLPARGMFTFLMRSIIMRHSHEQKYSGTQTTLMSLPPKVSLFH